MLAAAAIALLAPVTLILGAAMAALLVSVALMVARALLGPTVFDRLLAMKARGYPILNSVEHLQEIAKYLKDPTNPEILEKVCKVGIKNLNIDPFGNVRLCSIMDVVGNILTDSPEDIWRSANAMHQREEIRTCDKTCRLMFCNYKKLDFTYKAKRVLQGLTG